MLKINYNFSSNIFDKPTDNYYKRRPYMEKIGRIIKGRKKR